VIIKKEEDEELSCNIKKVMKKYKKKMSKTRKLKNFCN
jgi:hypothetical protein